MAMQTASINDASLNVSKLTVPLGLNIFNSARTNVPSVGDLVYDKTTQALCVGNSDATWSAVGPTGLISDSVFLGEFAGENNTASGNFNVGIGYSSMRANTTGDQNTAVGAFSLANSQTSTNNVALGYQAMNLNTTGSSNVAVGAGSLAANTTGSQNIAVGTSSMTNNTTGSNNTAVGHATMLLNTTGINNVSMGSSALQNNTSGNNNTAIGTTASEMGTTAADNVSVGSAALNLNTSGTKNVALGGNALQNNLGGQQNTAVGMFALLNTTGNDNIGIGFNGGQALTTGTNNIDIGNVGVAGESDTIRIGTAQAATFIAGINGTAIGANVPVLVNASGQLGTMVSSIKYKENVRDIGSLSDDLYSLRPVIYTVKCDNSEGIGFIAEEVAKVFPQLAIRNKNGEIESYKILELIPLLINEVQKLQLKVVGLETRLTTLSDKLDEKLVALEKI